MGKDETVLSREAWITLIEINQQMNLLNRGLKPLIGLTGFEGPIAELPTLLYNASRYYTDDKEKEDKATDIVFAILTSDNPSDVKYEMLKPEQ